MNDKDTKILEEAYNEINEGYPIDGADGDRKATIQYKDETSKFPQYIDVILHSDRTVTIKFGNSFRISRTSEEDAYKLSEALADLIRDRR